MIFGLRLSPREKWLVLAAVGSVVIFFLADSYLLPYWDSLGESREKIQVDARRVASYRRVLHGQDSVKAALEAVKQKTHSTEEGLLKSDTDALATAEMQGIVKQMVLAKGLTLRRTDLQPVKSISSDYSRVSTRVELAGAADQLVSLLAAMETSENILAVEEIRITPAESGGTKNKNLVVNLVVSALKRIEPIAETGAKNSSKEKS
jgi:type II secretion system (T2SS) protein M